jgi:hypothetical protein
MRFSLRRSQASRRPRAIPDDRIAVFGNLERGPLLLGSGDLQKLPDREQTADLGVFAEGETGRAVGFSAIVATAAPRPGTLYANFGNRDGSRRFSHFLSEIADLGWIGYAGNDASAGRFRLVLPGIHGDRGSMDDLAWIEFADEPCDDPIPDTSGPRSFD